MAFLTERASSTPGRADKTWSAGLPHVVAAGIAAPIWGIGPTVAGLLMATLIGFVVYVPLMVLALNGGAALPEDSDPPAAPPLARIGLLLLWTATAWTVAARAAALG